jgi:CubicO group peptidase (beta-lactamase class C family)
MLALALAGIAILHTSSPAQAPASPTLEGLWVGKERYGPDVRGSLYLVRRGGELRAEIAGFSVPVRRSGSRLSFELPDGKGSFRGALSGAAVTGQWIQERTVSSNARYATPHELRADGRGGWRGEVQPFEDAATYYLPLSAGSGGDYPTHLRNPERNTGAFLQVRRLETDGETVRVVGTRRGQKDERVLAAGRRDLEAGAFSIPIGGSTIDFRRDRESSSAFYPRGNPAERYRYSPPPKLDDGWPVSTLEQEGIDRAAIEKFVQKLIDMPMDGISSSQIHSLVIARNGKLVLEEYFHGHGRDTPHDTRSASKSWTNVLIGAAMQSGVPLRLDTPLYQAMLGSLPAGLDPRKAAVNLEHLISMTAGFDCDDSGDRPGDEDVYQDQSEEPDWYRYMLNVPIAWNSGEKIVYCSGKPNLAAGMLGKVAGEPLPELFHRLVAKPMRMGRYHLFLQPTGEAYGGGGHYFTTRDFMKLTQLFLNDGRWEGRQIVSRDWARKSSAPLRMLSPSRGQTYGYLWNSVAYPYRGRKVHAFFSGGNGGQVYIGIPELKLLIAFTGGNYGDPVLFRAQRNFVPEDILPAVK